jgi:hypothetical protein
MNRSFSSAFQGERAKNWEKRRRALVQEDWVDEASMTSGPIHLRWTLALYVRQAAAVNSVPVAFRDLLLFRKLHSGSFVARKNGPGFQFLPVIWCNLSWGRQQRMETRVNLHRFSSVCLL